MKRALTNALIRANLFAPAHSVYTAIRSVFAPDPFTLMELTGVAPPPTSAVFEITTKCNLSCGMCWLQINTERSRHEVTPDGMRTVLDRLPPSLRRITITGGELLLRREIFEICERLGRRGIEIMLLTNGFMPDRLRQLIAENPAVRKVQISLDGPRELHNGIRGSEKSFDRILESTGVLRGRPDIEANFLTVLMDENLDDLPALVDLASALGKKKTFFEFERRYDKPTLESSVTDFIRLEHYWQLTVSDQLLPAYRLERLKAAIDRVEAHARRKRLLVQYLPPSFRRRLPQWYARKIREEFKVRCGHFLVPRINAQGDVVPCFAISRPFGNLVERPFEEIWNSEEYRRFRMDMLRRNLLPICDTCYQCVPVARKGSGHVATEKSEAGLTS